MWRPQARHMTAAQREQASDAWIKRNIPGGLNSPLGQRMDEYFGGNSNPTLGQQLIGTGMGLAHFGEDPAALVARQQGEHRRRRRRAVPQHMAYPPTMGYYPTMGQYNPWMGW